MTADRSACRANLGACLPGWLEALRRDLLNTGFWCTEIDRQKKLLRIFGGLKNLSYLCTHNPQEKAVRSSRVKRS